VNFIWVSTQNQRVQTVIQRDRDREKHNDLRLRTALATSAVAYANKKGIWRGVWRSPAMFARKLYYALHLIHSLFYNDIDFITGMMDEGHE
jgi:hypothetical protein